MGGVDDEEPALKRMKVSAKGLAALSNGSSTLETVGGFSSNSMARPLPSEVDEQVVGSKGVIKREEFVRIIAKALYSLGYRKSGERLEEESGIPLHSPGVNLFTQQVLDGNWDESVATLHKIGLADENVVRSASCLILEQKFFELLHGEKVMEALMTLREEITPLCSYSSRIRELSSCLVSPSPKQDIVKVRSRSKLLEELQKLLPPTVMIPEKRLEHLVEQALILQTETCPFHNSMDKMSLYSDHHCGKELIPSRTVQILETHDDEVWFVQFSHNGQYLASASNDQTAIIWEVGVNGLSVKHRLSGHQKPVSSVSWSPNDEELLTCGVEESIRRWDVSTGKCLQIYEKAGAALVSCTWFPSGKHILSGLSDKSICMWELDGKEVESWKGQKSLKISDLDITDDGKEILSDPKLVGKYKGHRRSRFIIRSCFGGLKQAFIASGSEDSQVYIWHRSSDEPVEALPGHSGAVNCVSWNPANPHMLASASDDRTIRIWGLNNLNKKYQNGHSNGIHYCNGGT
ncbi:WD repeat-containing protein 26-like [Trifolium pratense]|uniref:WD repeat-containing protein 26-like n=1 Tax=Trifolium pratense TaxID=57577 RepID=A0A2K3PPG3_TRIPR|nr:WD repeat-containing protein 26-like [Trifolium pratense]